MDESQNDYAKWKKPHKKYTLKRQNIETKIRTVISRAGTVGGERVDTKSQEKAFWGDRKVLSAYGDAYTTAYISQNLPNIFF